MQVGVSRSANAEGRFLKGNAVWMAGLLAGLLTCSPGLGSSSSVDLGAQVIRSGSEVELAAITERGRALAEYDAAIWHATDAAQTANPKTVEGQHSLARRENGRWTVVFGTLSADKSKFLIRYEASQQLANAKEFAMKTDEPAKADEGFYLRAARAVELAQADFGQVSRPYNAAVLPVTGRDERASAGEFYVYFYPAQTKMGIYPLGGDMRYLVAADGMKILEKHAMHKTMIENPPAKGKKVVSGFHTHTLSDEPEDTDVLHVLQQDPAVPETITTRHYVYEIASDGAIRIKKQKK
jgi:hypothetical protein